MRKALEAAQLDERHRFHDLRHTFGTRMAAAGVPLRTLQEWMGHRDIATTQRYADYAPSAREAEMVAAAFARGTNLGTNNFDTDVTSDHPTALSGPDPTLASCPWAGAVPAASTTGDPLEGRRYPSGVGFPP